MKRNEQKIENTWKTEDIFKDEAAFLACLDTCKELGNELCAYDGKLKDASNLLSFLKGYEKLICLLDDCLGYSSLLSDQDTADAHHQKLKGKANALAVEIFTKLSFSDVQIMHIVQFFDHKLTEYTLNIPLINLRLLQPIQNSYSQKESHHIVRLNEQPFERLPQN